MFYLVIYGNLCFEVILDGNACYLYEVEWGNPLFLRSFRYLINSKFNNYELLGKGAKCQISPTLKGGVRE